MQASPEFRRERCTRYRFSYSECSRCHDACPHAAISLSDEGAAIDASRCQQCALCVAACPTEAWNTDKLPLIQLIKQATSKPEGFSMACTPSQAVADAIVPCLGALDATLLAYLAARKVKLELRGMWHCDSCPHGERGKAMLAYAREGFALLKDSAGGNHWGSITEADLPTQQHKAPTVNHDRRQLFRRAFGRALDEALKDAPSAPVPLKAVRVAAPLSTIRRELLQIVWPRQGEGEFPLGDSLPASRLEARESCNNCELCVRVCPTGAMGLAENNAAWRLTFQFNRCVGCDVCVEACQPNALAYLPSAPLALGLAKEPVTLLNRPKLRCKRCDRFFMPTRTDETLCPICDRDDKDFDWVFG